MRASDGEGLADIQLANCGLSPTGTVQYAWTANGWVEVAVLHALVFSRVQPLCIEPMQVPHKVPPSVCTLPPEASWAHA